jgi:hypothetical protein
MQQHTKTSYHPYLLVAFYLNCLPKNILQIIPRSTRFDWNHRDIQDSFGYDWFLKQSHYSFWAKFDFGKWSWRHQQFIAFQKIVGGNANESTKQRMV